MQTPTRGPYRHTYNQPLLRAPSAASLLVDKEARHALAGTYAHARQEDLLLGPPALAQARHDLAGAGGAERVAQRDGAALGVHLGPVELEGVAAVDGHAGKGLVDLDDVDVVDGEVVLLQELGDGHGRSDAHDARRQARDGGADVLGYDRLAELDGRGSLHEQDGSGFSSR